jgi:PRD1 phage membrane DNA delivery
MDAMRVILGLASAVIGLAVLSVILSTRSNTSSVIGAAGNALSSVIGAATSPVSGATVATSIPNIGNGLFGQSGGLTGL